MEINDKIKRYLYCVAKNEELEEQRLVYSREALALESEIARSLDEQGTEKITVEGGATIWPKLTLRARVNKGDKPELFDWLRERGDEWVITPDVHHARLSSYIKDCQEDGVKLPDYVKTETQFQLGRRMNGYNPLETES